MKKTHFAKSYKSDHLSSADVLEMIANGRAPIFTIDRGVEEVGIKVRGVKGDYKIIYFKDKGVKPMVLNRTNGHRISNFHPTKSPFIEDFGGIVIELYVDHKVNSHGEIVDGIRVKTKQPILNKTLPSITDERFAKALEAVKSGSYTKEQIKAAYSLTDTQKTKLNEL